MKMIPAHGTELATYSIGRGTPVIVIHGGPGIGHAYLRPGMDVLAEHFEAVYYDQRGTGNSPLGDPNRVTLGGSVEDLEAVRIGLGFEQLNLVGHSFGADLAVCYADEHPDRVGSLVLASPGPPFTPDLLEVFQKEMQRRRPEENLSALQKLQASEGVANRDPKTLEDLHRETYAPFFRDAQMPRRVDFGFTRITADNVMEAGGRMFRDLVEMDPLRHLSAVRSPALVIHAELDPLPVAFSRQIADGIPGAEFRLLEGVNHFAFMEDQAPFFGTVVPFLQKHAR